MPRIRFPFVTTAISARRSGRKDDPVEQKDGIVLVSQGSRFYFFAGGPAGGPSSASFRKRPDLRHVGSNGPLPSSDWWGGGSGAPSSPTGARHKTSQGCFLSFGVSCSLEMISPPSAQRLSRCLRKVARERFEFSRWRKNGVKYSTIFSPDGTSRSSYRQLLGHWSRSGQ